MSSNRLDVLHLDFSMHLFGRGEEKEGEGEGEGEEEGEESR